MKNSKLKFGVKTVAATVLTLTLFTGLASAKERFTLDRNVDIHLNAYDAKTGRNSIGKYSAGEYYIYREFNGAINISKNEKLPGAWIYKEEKVEENSDKEENKTQENSIVKVSENEVELTDSVKIYMTANNSLTGRNPVGTYSEGKYKIFYKVDGAINITKKEGVPGGWISIEQNEQETEISETTIEVNEPSYEPVEDKAEEQVEEVEDYEEEYVEESTPSYSGLKEQIVATARSYVGYSYSWASASPSTGFDCSGLVKYVYGSSGIYLPHSSSAQSGNGYYVSADELQAGDLLFFGSSSYISHVGIYSGEGTVIHALSESTGVVEDSLWSGWNASNFLFAKRIVD